MANVSHRGGGSGVTPLPSVDARLDALEGRWLSVADYGAVLDGITDDTDAINAAIEASADQLATVMIAGTAKVTSTVTMVSLARVRLHGRLVGGSQTPIIDFDGVDDAIWEGGEIVGDGATSGQTGVILNDAERNVIRDVVVSSCLNKGIALTGASTDNLIEVRKISGGTSSTGAGLSIFGADVKRNVVRGGYYTGNRIGITFNGGERNAAIGVNASGNTAAGMMLDGMVTNAGDGPKYCSIIGGNFDDNASASYGGIYLGNGASYNRIVGVSACGNTGAGIRASATQGTNDNVRNEIESAICRENLATGLNLSASPRTRIIGGQFSENTGNGIQLFKSDYAVVVGAETDSNTAVGLKIQSGFTQAVGIRSMSNGTYGYQVASGGSSDSHGNTITASDVTGNTTDDYSVTDTLGRIDGCTNADDAVHEVGDASLSYFAGTRKTLTATTALTANRTITLENERAWPGDTVRVVRTASGASTLTIKDDAAATLKALATGQWATCVFNGTGWILAQFGSL